MDLAIHTPQQVTDLSLLGDLWQAADELGYAAAFTFDHLVPLYPGERPGTSHDGTRTGAQLDGWMAAAALAARTRRLQTGTLVSGVTYRHPFVLAKMAVTLDHLTGGRAILGVGAGWHREEHDMAGLGFPPASARVELLEETLQAFRLLCGPGETTFHGRHIRLNDAIFEPKPVRSGGIPVLVGGNGAGVMGVAGRHAQTYNGFWSPEDWPDAHRTLDEHALRHGRSPGDLRRSGYTFADLSRDRNRAEELVRRTADTRGGDHDSVRMRLLTGDDEQLAAVLERYRAARLDLLVVNLEPGTAPEDLARLISAGTTGAASTEDT